MDIRVGPFLRALDTVTNITAFMLYELLKHPDLLERVTAEADALFAGGMPTVKDLRELDVLHRAAMETMRRHSLTPMIQRTVSNSFEFEGYTIPSGARIFLALSLPHNMSEYFPDPQRFDIRPLYPRTGRAPAARCLCPFWPGGAHLPGQQPRRSAHRAQHRNHLARNQPDTASARLQIENQMVARRPTQKVTQVQNGAPLIAQAKGGVKCPAQNRRHNSRVYHSIDSLRAVTMLLVLVFHAAIIYLPFDTDRVLYQDEMRSPFTGWVVLFTRLFHMPVFFLVSGFFARLFVRYPGAMTFLSHRLKADRASPRLQLSGAVSTMAAGDSLYQIPDGGDAPLDVERDLRSFVQTLGIDLWHLWFLYQLLIFVCRSPRPLFR